MRGYLFYLSLCIQSFDISLSLCHFRTLILVTPLILRVIVWIKPLLYIFSRVIIFDASHVNITKHNIHLRTQHTPCTQMNTTLNLFMHFRKTVNFQFQCDSYFEVGIFYFYRKIWNQYPKWDSTNKNRKIKM